MPLLLVLLIVCFSPITALAIGAIAHEELNYRWRNRHTRRRTHRFWWYGE